MKINGHQLVYKSVWSLDCLEVANSICDQSLACLEVTNYISRLLVLPEVVEAPVVFSLGTGQADVGCRNPGPPDAAVCGPDYSDCHYNLILPQGT